MNLEAKILFTSVLVFVICANIKFTDEKDEDLEKATYIVALVGLFSLSVALASALFLVWSS